MFLGPRLVLFCAWLLSNWYSAFSSSLLALLGFLFLPWTSLAWMHTFFHNHGQLDGGYVVLVALGVLMDIGVFGGGGRAGARRWLELA
jgi:hypothetical protein